MNLFYSTNIDGDVITLDEIESRHCIKVLRLKEGDSVLVIDGKGNLYNTVIVSANKKHSELNVIDVSERKRERENWIHIAIAPTKNISRLEWFVEKVTEIGVDEISLIACFHSERRKVNIDRLEKLIVSAMKQSRKYYKPILNPVIDFEKFIKLNRKNVEMYIAHCNDEENRVLLSSQYNKKKNVEILIGPEGDFSDNEINLAKQSGYLPVSLGNSRLRTETAGIVACSTINILAMRPLNPPKWGL